MSEAVAVASLESSCDLLRPDNSHCFRTTERPNLALLSLFSLEDPLHCHLSLPAGWGLVPPHWNDMARSTPCRHPVAPSDTVVTLVPHRIISAVGLQRDSTRIGKRSGRS